MNESQPEHDIAICLHMGMAYEKAKAVPPKDRPLDAPAAVAAICTASDTNASALGVIIDFLERIDDKLERIAVAAEVLASAAKWNEPDKNEPPF